MPSQDPKDPEFLRKLQMLRNHGIQPQVLEINFDKMVDAICSSNKQIPRQVVTQVLSGMGEWLEVFVVEHANRIDPNYKFSVIADATTQIAAMFFQIAIFRRSSPDAAALAELIADHVYALGFASKVKETDRE